MGSVNHRFDFEKLKETTVKRKERIQMKKSSFRKLSLFLAVVFIISMMPAAVFAAEDEHMHTGDCCSDVAVPYVTCTHSSMSSVPYYAAADNGASTHTVYEGFQFTCNNAACGYSYVNYTNTYAEAHDYTLSNGGTAAACIICGHLRDA